MNKRVPKIGTQQCRHLRFRFKKKIDISKCCECVFTMNENRQIEIDFDAQISSLQNQSTYNSQPYFEKKK